MFADRRWIPAAVLIAAGSAVIVGTTGDTDAASRLDASLPSDLGEASPESKPSTPAALREPRVPRPSSLAIPSIDVHSDLSSLGLRADRTLEVPAQDDADRAGWYRGSARPGARGPAVVVGHVDSMTGPAVFYRLSELEPGDTIIVGRQDGSMVRFSVTHIGRYPKDDFPTEAVYSDTRDPQLRLITCGGDYRAEAGGYVDNIVVFASIAAPAERHRR